MSGLSESDIPELSKAYSAVNTIGPGFRSLVESSEPVSMALFRLVKEAVTGTPTPKFLQPVNGLNVALTEAGLSDAAQKTIIDKLVDKLSPFIK